MTIQKWAEVIERDIQFQARELADRMETLSLALSNKAKRLRNAPITYTIVSGLGEVAQNGTFIDAKCGALSKSLAILNDIRRKLKDETKEE